MNPTSLPRRTDRCSGCPLEGTSKKSKHVPTEVIRVLEDSRDIDVLFVGEAPGAEEEARCRPFIGKSGKFVRTYIEKYAKTNYAIANCCRCRPTDSKGGNRPPTPEERNHCVKYLWEDIQRLKPKKIVALGGVAAGAFIDGFRSVAAIRGQEIPIRTPLGFRSTLFPTYHPAARDV